MYFQQLLLLIIHKFQGERSSTAPYYLLKGKKSGQTIQDVTYFQLHSYFSLYPKLAKETYEEAIKNLHAEGLIVMNESRVAITEKGLHQIVSIRRPFYSGWILRGKEFIFWGRVELIVQTLSQFQGNEKKFVPVQKSNEIHHFVKVFLQERDFQSSSFGAHFKKQLFHLLENPLLLEIHRNLFVYRLSGYKNSGLTWEQLASHHHMTVLDVKFLFIECLHILLNDITEEKYPDLHALTKGIYVQTPLTDSAFKTSKLFEKGYTIEEIARMRFLKENTIEDHVIEIVSADPTFPLQAFISKEQVQKVLHIAQERQTKKLKIIREELPDLSYFQIRLALTKGEEING
ncbi:helix-turn-helix domain-containing protein [Psychrobacillus sp. NEAU-3TGS]|uniref:helix-turn-helix domain-containing protein n=1 Tax=Psychrobacillus sp. NEAU-3TGS TaxID=2995412 RepID=UPI0024974489|nr:helix-turn-helix domain-containing protein [Psychrobacillus sp. NEAU-3TGS]MDI2589144.1 helix-turn-helix domain-containing protein [Psychrobacillus sp. NEAU-3TGS]